MRLSNLAFLFLAPALLSGQEPVTPIEPAPPANTANTAPAAFTPLTTRQKVSWRAIRVVEPFTLVNSAFGAGIDQWRNKPKEWGQGMEGYACRFASAEGFIAAHNTIALGFDVAFHVDPRYRRRPDARFGPRLWNAVSQTILANTDSGGKIVNVSEFAGNFGAGFVSNTWQPERYSSTGDALTRGAMGLMYHTIKNIGREFLPNLMHPGKHSSTGSPRS
jgi:hypothetical protein